MRFTRRFFVFRSLPTVDYEPSDSLTSKSVKLRTGVSTRCRPPLPGVLRGFWTLLGVPLEPLAPNQDAAIRAMGIRGASDAT